MRDFVEISGKSQAQLALEAGVKEATFSRHMHGLRRPGPAMIDTYAAITKGAVTAQDWQDLAREVAERDSPSQEPVKAVAR